MRNCLLILSWSLILFVGEVKRGRKGGRGLVRMYSNYLTPLQPSILHINLPYFYTCVSPSSSYHISSTNDRTTKKQPYILVVSLEKPKNYEK